MLTSALLLFPFFHFPGFFLVISLLLYFLPAFLAREKHNFTAIFILNLLAGWTFIGWIIALVWAVTSDPQRQPASQYQQAMASPGQQPAYSTPQATYNAAPPATTPPFFCSKCGKRCTAGERFCSTCGTALPATPR